MGIAHKMAKKQKEISIAEFFEKNKQILGFDSLTKAMVVSVKEAVDNSLDACEEARILPDILVIVESVGKDEYRIIVEDNGPGIVRKNIPLVFGKLLYGSRFHAIRQSRGQQGIGISAVVLYGQLTTGKPARIISKIREDEVAYEVILTIDTKKNEPKVIKETPIIWDREEGTHVEVTIRGRYIRGKQSILEYLQQTAIVNPHAQITFVDPDGRKIIFKRAADILPQPTREIKPHPYGIELGQLLNMARSTKAYRLTSFLTTEFSRVSPKIAEEICKKAYLYGDMRPKDLTIEEAKRLMESFNKVKLMAPPTDCLSPIGENLIKKGLKNVLGSLKPGFYARPITREPKVYGGNPFIVEAGLVYGGELPKDQPVKILRFANRVPLLYQQGG
ncbi:MAG TPA: DNA topoisomerase VI subunit B, partial [Candidatus Aciduliprofundum boonei]|nr:DNA topoisomerase VI subunit B [Candidatus Aciduliprofundum boonei]